MNYRRKGRSLNLGKSAAKAMDTAIGNGSNSFYDPKSGLFLLFVLALVLWWIIPLGQMVAGYVGGRRAGSMSRGLAVATAGSAILIALSLVVTAGAEWLLSLQNVQDFIASTVPSASDWITSLGEYMSGFAGISSGSVTIAAGDFVMMGVFAIVGGAMANQSRKEMSIIVGHALREGAPKPPRSARAAMEGRQLGFGTYADYTALTVNSTAGTEARAQEKPAPVQPKPKRAEVTATTAAAVTASVTPTSSLAAATATVSVPVPGPAKPEAEKAAPKKAPEPAPAKAEEPAPEEVPKEPEAADDRISPQETQTQQPHAAADDFEYL